MAYPEDLWKFPAPEIDTTINLNEQGLDPGDSVDSYINQYWGENVRLEIDPGTYDFDGSGLQQTFENAQLVGTGATGDVVFDGDFNVTLRAIGDGTVHIKNITVHGEPYGNFRVEAPGGDAEIVCEDIRLPDHASSGSDANGFFACGDPCNTIHNGTLRLLWCQSVGHADNGMYADGPSENEYGDGRVVLVGGEYRGNNISDIRVGTDDTDVYRATIHADGTHPRHANGGLNARGLRIRQPGDNLYINDCDIVYETSGGGAVTFDNAGVGGSGTIRNTRIRNESSTPAISADDPSQVDSNWSATDIHITGNGDLSSHVTLEGDSQVGSGADEPDLTPWWGQDTTDPDDGTDGGIPTDPNMVDFVFPEDTGTGASTGDNADAANFATQSHAIGPSDFVVSGFELAYNSTDPSVDVGSGKAVVSDTLATASTSGEPRTDVSYVVQMDTRNDVSLTDGAVNHVWLDIDLSEDDSITVVTDVNETNAPDRPMLKIGEVNTSTNTVDEQNRGPVVEGRRMLLSDIGDTPSRNGEFTLDGSDVYVQTGDSTYNLSDILQAVENSDL